MLGSDHGSAARSPRNLAIAAITALACLVAIPAAASASTAFVSPAPVKAPFNSCASPGYNSIQSAINSPTTTIHVCAGNYKEQLTITRALTLVGAAGAKVELPASPSLSRTACDVQQASYEEQDLVTLCGTGAAETVKVSGLAFEDSGPSTAECGKQFFGILVGGNLNLVMTGSQVLHAGANPINGCQQGVAVQVGHHYVVNTVGTATLSGDTITGYQKNGITVDNAGSKATIKSDTITSAPTAETAQNGVQISRGAEGKVISSEITGNECNHSSCGTGSLAEEGEDSTGVLFFEEAKGSVTGSKISKNDIGVYHYGQCCTSTNQATITGNTLEEDRYWGMVLDQGLATVTKNKILAKGSGRVGIQLIQYAGQEFGANGKGAEDEINEMTKCAVEGFSDNNSGDQFASLTLTGSLAKFTGDATNVCNNNTNGKLVIHVS
jgi:nitrous oxidase accessory protein NosD